MRLKPLKYKRKRNYKKGGVNHAEKNAFVS